MLEPLALLGTGFVLGTIHAGDPDHVVAVTTIVSRERSVWRAARVGALWGMGHAVPLLLLGGAIVVLRVVIPPRLGLALEFGVALMLIGLGMANLAHRRLHRRHDGSERAPRAAASGERLRPLAIGVVHGLAGSAAVALYVLTRVDAPALAVASLLLFGLGTVGGMMLITTLIGTPATYIAARFPGAGPYVRVAAGIVSLGFGLLLAHRIGIEDGLFTTHPVWSAQ